MAAKRPSVLSCRAGGKDVSGLLDMMTLTPAAPLEAVRDASRRAHKGSMLESSAQDNPAQRTLTFGSAWPPEENCVDLSLQTVCQPTQREFETEYRLELDIGNHSDLEEHRTGGEPKAGSVQCSAQSPPKHVPGSGRTQRGPEVDLGSETSDPSSHVVAWSQKFSSIEPLVVSRRSASSHAQPQPWRSREESAIKTPSPSSVIPIMEKLLSGSDKSQSDLDTYGTSSSSEHSDRTDSEKQRLDDAVDAAVVRRTMSRLQESLQGFLFGPSKELEDFLMKIVSKPRDFGIYIYNQFNPSSENGVMRYRPGKEFTIKKTIHHSQNKNCGVYLCADNCTKQQFVLKKIMMHNRRLIGIEFLTRHDKAFLPKIYGVYKERDCIHIFEEFVEGGTLLTCEWNLAQVRQFAETLLSAFHYLHTHDLAHCDVKLMNLMVRDPSDPESLVLIDFESAKHPQYTFHKGGHTVTYLPPWYDRLLDLNSYDPVLKTADLWAIACVIIFFLLPSDRSDVQERSRGVWNQAMEDIKNKCDTCRNSASRKYCDTCKKNVMLHIKSNGHRILDIHLGHLMDSNIDDPNWLALRGVLKYLTDTGNIEEKHIDIALSLVKGSAEQQPTVAVEVSSKD